MAFSTASHRVGGRLLAHLSLGLGISPMQVPKQAEIGEMLGGFSSFFASRRRSNKATTGSTKAAKNATTFVGSAEAQSCQEFPSFLFLDCVRPRTRGAQARLSNCGLGPRRKRKGQISSIGSQMNYERCAERHVRLLCFKMLMPVLICKALRRCSLRKAWTGDDCLRSLHNTRTFDIMF